MSITVRLIFWGLIGLAPDWHAERGMAALLVDPRRVQTDDHDDCPIPRHLAAIYLLEGECTGDCGRITPGYEVEARLMGFKVVNGKPVANDHGPLELAWLINREDLDISGDEDEKLKLRKPLLDLFSKTAPGSENRAEYFRWVQDLGGLVQGGMGSVRLDCRRGEHTCPLHARFNVQGGKASSCHLFHNPEPDGSTSTKRDVRLMTYTMPGKKPFQRAVSDAVLVEFTEDGESVRLTSQALPGWTRPKAEAYLKPDAKGRLTLVVANFPPVSSAHSCHKPHSDFLYSLLAVQPTVKAERDDSIEITKRGPAGACEPEAIRISKLLGINAEPGNEEPPHSTTSCDNGSFKP